MDPANVIWHHTIDQRREYDPSFRLGSRRVICGIRRLPYWVLSKTFFEIEREPHHLVGTRKMILRGETFEADGSTSLADFYARGFSTTPVDHWIRIENIIEDAAIAFNVSQRTFEGAMTVRNKTGMDYVKDLRFWFTPDELAGLYAANPTWAAIERQVYGSLLTLP